MCEGEIHRNRDLSQADEDYDAEPVEDRGDDANEDGQR